MAGGLWQDPKKKSGRWQGGRRLGRHVRVDKRAKMWRAEADRVTECKAAAARLRQNGTCKRGRVRGGLLICMFFSITFGCIFNSCTFFTSSPAYLPSFYPAVDWGGGTLPLQLIAPFRFSDGQVAFFLANQEFIWHWHNISRRSICHFGRFHERYPSQQAHAEGKRRSRLSRTETCLGNSARGSPAWHAAAFRYVTPTIR